MYYNRENAETMIYEMLNENYCDRYNARDQMSAEQKRRNAEELRKEEKRRWLQDYERHRIDTKKEIMIQSLHEIDVTKIINKLQNECPACWLNCRDEIYHEMKSCANWKFMRMKHDEFKFDIKYAKNYACVNCSLSCDWCSKYVEEEIERCRRKDVIMPMVMRCRLMHHGQKMIKRLAKKEFEREKNYIKWLRKTWHIFNRKNTNAFQWDV